LLFQNKYKEAASKFKTLADNPNLFIINEFANYKFSEMMLAEDEISLAIQTLEKISENSKNPIFSDKSTFLLAITYQYGLKDSQKASEYYQKILEKFPNSLYFDRARDSLNKLQTNNG
jgi:tetratricopeptide (TPR) repeat protein